MPYIYTITDYIIYIIYIYHYIYKHICITYYTYSVLYVCIFQCICSKTLQVPQVKARFFAFILGIRSRFFEGPCMAIVNLESRDTAIELGLICKHSYVSLGNCYSLRQSTIIASVIADMPKPEFS